MYELKTPPRELEHDLPPELFEKAQKYGKDKTRYSVVKNLVDQLVSLYLIRAGVYHRAWDSAAKLMDAFGFTQDYTVRLCARALPQRVPLAEGVPRARR